METLNYWPLVVILEDVFIPEFAALTLQVAAEWDEPTCTCLIKLAAIDAEEDLEMRIN
jgi:hypothetical protein